jgi:hypothetical protein
MKLKKKDPNEGIAVVRIDKKVVQMVRDHKKKTYIPIGEFFRLAALEKLGKK